MNLPLVVGVGVAGGLGAVARLAVTRTVAARAGLRLPAGTLVTNLSGAFLLGLIVGAGFGVETLRLLGAGALGGYTTFSTLAVESDELAQRTGMWRGVASFFASIAVGLVAIFVGRLLGGLL